MDRQEFNEKMKLALVSVEVNTDNLKDIVKDYVRSNPERGEEMLSTIENKLTAMILDCSFVIDHFHGRQAYADNSRNSPYRKSLTRKIRLALGYNF